MGHRLLPPEFAVQRPGRALAAFKGDLTGGKARHRPVLGQLQRGQGGEDGLPVLAVFRPPDQDDFKPPVVQQHLIPGQAHQPPHRHGVAHHAIDEVPLRLPAAIGAHPHVVAGDVGQLAHPLQHIGEVPQQVFIHLGGGIGHVGEQPEGGHIGKGVPLRQAHVDVPQHPLPRHLRQLRQGAGQLQGAGKVVRGARRDVAQHRPPLPGQLQHPPDGLVQRAVPAAAHHPVKIRPLLPGRGGGVSPGLGGTHGDLVALTGKYLQRVGQVDFGALAAGGGVIDVQQLFHGRSLHTLSGPQGGRM